MDAVVQASILPFMVFLPVLGALIMVPLATKRVYSPLLMVLLISSVELSFVVGFFFMEFPKDASPVLAYTLPWLDNVGLNLSMSLDRLSYPFLALTALMFVLTSIYSMIHKPKRPLLFAFCFAVLQATLYGAFLANDLLLFYIFWETLLIPMALIIGVFGSGRRIYSAVKFLLFTVFGSLPMLLSIIYLYLIQYKNGGDLSTASLYELQLPFKVQFWMFLSFFLAFAVKFPLFPVHSWLPDAHGDAPTEGSVILAAILLKLGSYGLLRFALPIFPEVAVKLVELLSPFAIVSVIYASLICLVQTHAKRLIAYSSVSHMGFVALGLLAFNLTGFQGSIYQMLNHGITTGALFFLIGMLYHRSDKRGVDDFGGLASITPKYAVLFSITALSSIGLPGLNNFVGEFLIVFGLFKSVLNPNGMWLAAASLLGIILGAAYLLWMYRRIFFGKVKEGVQATIGDLKIPEMVIILPLVILMFIMGLFPSPILRFIEPSSSKILATVQQKVYIAEQKSR